MREGIFSVTAPIAIVVGIEFIGQSIAIHIESARGVLREIIEQVGDAIPVCIRPSGACQNQYLASVVQARDSETTDKPISDLPLQGIAFPLQLHHGADRHGNGMGRPLPVGSRHRLIAAILAGKGEFQVFLPIGGRNGHRAAGRQGGNTALHSACIPEQQLVVQPNVDGKIAQFADTDRRREVPQEVDLFRRRTQVVLVIVSKREHVGAVTVALYGSREARGEIAVVVVQLNGVGDRQVSAVIAPRNATGRTGTTASGGTAASRGTATASGGAGTAARGTGTRRTGGARRTRTTNARRSAAVAGATPSTTTARCEHKEKSQHQVFCSPPRHNKFLLRILLYLPAVAVHLRRWREHTGVSIHSLNDSTRNMTAI